MKAAPTPDISVILVSFNVREFLGQALHSILKALQGIQSEVFVVDNASRDGTVAFLRKEFPTVSVIANAENVGFARANNQAIRRARGKYLVLINPDTLVQEDTFAVLLDFFQQHPEAGLVGCKILNPDGSLQLACRRSFPTPWVALARLLGLSKLFPQTKLFGRYNLTYLDPDQTTPVDAVSGSFMMVRREVIDQVGLLDEQFFMYGEDLDWCYRIKQAGWEIYYVPQTQIIHYKGASTERARLDTVMTFYRAMLIFVRKHFRNRYLFLPQWFLFVGIALRAGISFAHNLFLRIRLPLIDLIVLNFSLSLALLTRFHSLVHWRSYILVTAIYSTVWLLSFYLADLYHNHKFAIDRAVAAVISGLAINSALTFFAKSVAFSRLVVLYAGAFNLLLIPGWRWAVRRAAESWNWPWLERLRKKYFRNETIVVGDESFIQKMIEKAQSGQLPNTEIIAALPIGSEASFLESALRVPVVSDLDNLPWHIEQLGANEVIFSTDSVSYEKLLALISAVGGTGVEFKMVSGKPEVLIGSHQVTYLGDIPLIEIDHRLAHAPYRFMKRTVDISLSLFLLPFLIPCWIWMLLVGYRFRAMKIVVPDQHSPRGFQLKRIWHLSRGESGPLTFLMKSPMIFPVLGGTLSMVGGTLSSREQASDQMAVFRNLKPGIVSLFSEAFIQKEPEQTLSIFINYLKNYTPITDIKLFWQELKKR